MADLNFMAHCQVGIFATVWQLTTILQQHHHMHMHTHIHTYIHVHVYRVTESMSVLVARPVKRQNMRQIKVLCSIFASISTKQQLKAKQQQLNFTAMKL